MADRDYLEAKDNWQATFRHTRAEVRNPFVCLMRCVNGGYYWHVPDYQGLFPCSATYQFYVRGTRWELNRGDLEIVAGELPAELTPRTPQPQLGGN